MLILLFCLYIIYIYNNENFVSLYSTQKLFVGEMPLDILTWKTSFGNCLAFFLKLLQVLKEGGVRALWKGAVPNMQRAALVNLGDLTTYDQVDLTIWKPN